MLSGFAVLDVDTVLEVDGVLVVLWKVSPGSRASASNMVVTPRNKLDTIVILLWVLLGISVLAISKRSLRKGVG